MPLGRLFLRLRENINVRIYGSKSHVINVLRVIRLVFALLMTGFLIYFHGFPQTEAGVKWGIFLIRAGFSFFIFSYLVRLFFDFEPLKFIRSNWVEGLVLLLISADGLTGLFTGTSLISRWFNKPVDALMILQFILILIVFIELGKASQFLGKMKVKPGLLFALSYILLSIVGCGLLMMPEMVREPGSVQFQDALFTSVSASCITGLTVVDTATFFSLKGQVVILILFQLGGLNLIAFAAFFGAFMRRGVGIRAGSMLKDFMDYNSLADTRNMLRRIIGFTLILELCGSMMVYMSWSPAYSFSGEGERLFVSVFHAVSAFNNSGFSVIPQGLAHPELQGSLVTFLVLGLLSFLGGIGMPVLNDWLHPSMMRLRMEQPWRRLQLSSRLAIYTSIILIVIGMVGMYLFESSNLKQWGPGGMRQMNWFYQLIHVMFQSSGSRSVGYNTLDFGIMSNATLMLFMFLMFVGASPGGTGGGIKTTTMSLIALSAWTTIRGKKYVEIFRNTISPELLYKAFSIFLFTLTGMFVGTIALNITDPEFDFLTLAFEEVSAFSTTGLSTGITSQLSPAGKAVLIISMIVGRVGVLTMALSLSRKAITNRYKYPDAHIMLG